MILWKGRNVQWRPTAVGVEGVKQLAGKHVGYSEWLEITQERVNLFADATGDHQWIHVDPERAKQSPFGGPIAHGYLTLSLTPYSCRRSSRSRASPWGSTTAPTRCGSPPPCRWAASCAAAPRSTRSTEIAGGVQMKLTLTFEVQGSEKPACVATIIVRHYL